MQVGDGGISELHAAPALPLPQLLLPQLLLPQLLLPQLLLLVCQLGQLGM